MPEAVQAQTPVQTVREEIGATAVTNISATAPFTAPLILKDNPFAGLVAPAAPAIVNNVIDGFVTPAWIRESFSKPSEESFQLGLKDVRYALFETPTSFRVIFEREGETFNALFRLQDWGWELVDLLVPLETLKEAAGEASVIPPADRAIR